MYSAAREDDKCFVLFQSFEAAPVRKQCSRRKVSQTVHERTDVRAYNDGCGSIYQSAWHFNKRHWNDLRVEDLPDEIIKREIRHSYLTVIRKNITPKALLEELLRIAIENEIEDAEIEE